jgi:hypothetical protein
MQPFSDESLDMLLNDMSPFDIEEDDLSLNPMADPFWEKIMLVKPSKIDWDYQTIDNNSFESMLFC